MSEPTNTFDYPSRAATPERIAQIRKVYDGGYPLTIGELGDATATAEAYHRLRPIAAALVAAWADYCDADDNGWTERREQLADHIDGLMGQLREVIA